MENNESTQKRTGNGPNFFKKLLGETVCVNFVDGTKPVEGILVGYSRYEILLESQSGLVSMVMKHAILMVIPIGDKKNPLKPVRNDDKTEVQ